MLNFKLKKEEPTGCCSVQPKGKVSCPKCQLLAKGVLSKTVEYLLTECCLGDVGKVIKEIKMV